MSRKAEYDAWIEKHLRENDLIAGTCHETSKAMQECFPELQLVPGHVIDAFAGLRGHWWLTAPDGTIVDPTASQFSEVLEYVPYVEGDALILGKCMHCGSKIWGVPDGSEHRFCDDACERSFARSLQADLYP